MMSSASCFLTMARQIGPQISGLFMTRSQKPDTLFTPFELVMVMSHYNIGAISAVEPFKRGSAASPKIILTTASREYLLKRRAPGKDDLELLQISHGIQLHLANQQFPLPHLIGTRKENNSMLQLFGGIYELFEYIRGTGYDNSLESTLDSGRILALYHKLLRDYTPEFEPATGSYHYNRGIGTSLDQIPDTVVRTEKQKPVDVKDVSNTLYALREAYVQAADKTNKMGILNWPLQIVHCDWHPGNMLFRNKRVVAVIDYDAARLQQRIIDLANGVLQFSILGGGDDPSQWPDHVDEARFTQFIRGYDAVDVISEAEVKAIPWLMIEAMVAESAFHIAATGSFGRIEGVGFLKMIERKVAWVTSHADHLIQLCLR